MPPRGTSPDGLKVGLPLPVVPSLLGGCNIAVAAGKVGRVGRQLDEVGRALNSISPCDHEQLLLINPLITYTYFKNRKKEEQTYVHELDKLNELGDTYIRVAQGVVQAYWLPSGYTPMCALA